MDESRKMPRLTVRDFAGHIDAVQTYLESGKYPPVSSNAKRAIRRSAVNNYKVENGILYYRTHSKGKKTEDGSTDEEGQRGPWREVVKSEDERQLIMTDMHCSNNGRNHLGRDRMLAKVEAIYWWPSIYEDVKRFIRVCENCRGKPRIKREFPVVHKDSATKRVHRSVAKASSPPKLIKIRVKPAYFWSTIGLELLGPCCMTSCGNQYIMTVTCQATQWVEARAIPTGSFGVSVRFLADLFLRYGFPHTVISCVGKQIRAIINQVSELLNTEEWLTASYHPHCLYTNERLNPALDEKLLKVTRGFADWDLKIEQFMSSYRRTPQGSLNRSPYHMVFGFEPTLPSGISEPSDDDETSVPVPFETAKCGGSFVSGSGDENRDVSLQFTPLGFSLP